MLDQYHTNVYEEAGQLSADGELINQTNIIEESNVSQSPEGLSLTKKEFATINTKPATPLEAATQDKNVPLWVWVIVGIGILYFIFK